MERLCQRIPFSTPKGASRLLREVHAAAEGLEAGVGARRGNHFLPAGGPIGVMLAEHEQARALIRQMVEAADSAAVCSRMTEARDWQGKL